MFHDDVVHVVFLGQDEQLIPVVLIRYSFFLPFLDNQYYLPEAITAASGICFTVVVSVGVAFGALSGNTV